MIYLTLDTATTVYVEANELNTSGFYLWRVIRLQDRSEVVAYLTPAAVTERAAEFSIDLPNDLAITKKGDYKAIIYDGDGIDPDFTNFDTLEVIKIMVEA